MSSEFMLQIYRSHIPDEGGIGKKLCCIKRIAHLGDVYFLRCVISLVSVALLYRNPFNG